MSGDTVEKISTTAEARRRARREGTGEAAPWSCDVAPPPLLYLGIEQFNRGEYFEQHETLERLWLEEAREIRRLYQGILKIGVGFYKLRLGNYRGTVNHIRGGIAYLQRFSDTCLGVDVARLIREAEAVHERVVALGPQRISEFDLATLPRVWIRPADPE
jgi:predicted metal-dependent hydrolase